MVHGKVASPHPAIIATNYICPKTNGNDNHVSTPLHHPNNTLTLICQTSYNKARKFQCVADISSADEGTVISMICMKYAIKLTLCTISKLTYDIPIAVNLLNSDH